MCKTFPSSTNFKREVYTTLRIFFFICSKMRRFDSILVNHHSKISVFLFPDRFHPSCCKKDVVLTIQTSYCWSPNHQVISASCWRFYRGFYLVLLNLHVFRGCWCLKIAFLRFFLSKGASVLEGAFDLVCYIGELRGWGCAMRLWSLNLLVTILATLLSSGAGKPSGEQPLSRIEIHKTTLALHDSAYVEASPRVLGLQVLSDAVRLNHESNKVILLNSCDEFQWFYALMMLHFQS